MSDKVHLAFATLILLLAGMFTIHSLSKDVRFHPDEAYFMTFARNASVNGQWMLDGALDKPPVAIYASALAMRLTAVDTDENGVLQLDIYKGEFASRLPNIFAAIVLVAVSICLARDLYSRREIALVAGTLLALCSYLIAFSATAFTDVLMVTFGMLSLLLTTRKHWGLSGFFLALAFATKPQAVFFVPLILGIGWIKGFGSWRSIARIVLFFVLGTSILILWDLARPEDSIFSLAFVNNMSDKPLIAPLDSLIERIIVLVDFGRRIFGHAVITIVIILGSILSLKGANRQESWLNRFIIIWIIAYIAFHIFINVNLYDRYLLMIVPLICITGAYGIWQFLQWEPLQSSIAKYAPIGAVLIALLLSAFIASEQIIGIGGDDGTHSNVDDLAEYLNSKSVATVIYDYWLGWELGYYMGQWNDKRLVYHPTPSVMVQDALSLDEPQTRYFPVPVDVNADAWIQAFVDEGFTVQEDYTNENFRVYAIMPPS